MRKKRDKKTPKKALSLLLLFLLLFRAHVKSLSRYYSREREKRAQREILPLLLFFLSSTSERESVCNKSEKNYLHKSPPAAA